MSVLLIPTIAQDSHAFAVAVLMERMGHVAHLWFSERYPTHDRVWFEEGDEGRSAGMRIPGVINAYDIDVVWWRRFVGFRPSRALVHEDDFGLVDSENRLLAIGMADLLAPQARWVNRPLGDSIAANKQRSMQLAKEAGLRIPRTLLTNDRIQAADFIRRVREKGGEAVHKTLLQHKWVDGAPARTAVITEEQLAGEAIFSQCPAIIQERIEKRFEVRATFMGDAYCAVSYNHAEGGRTHLDSRVVMSRPGSCLRHELPVQVVAACRSLMKGIGICFGCFDLVVDTSGHYCFLEVNPQGQFLWKEAACEEVCLLEPFCQFLVNGEVSNQAFDRRPQSVLWADVGKSEEYALKKADANQKVGE